MGMAISLVGFYVAALETFLNRICEDISIQIWITYLIGANILEKVIAYVGEFLVPCFAVLFRVFLICIIHSSIPLKLLVHLKPTPPHHHKKKKRGL